jgi:prophage tail gpP-like protein
LPLDQVTLRVAGTAYSGWKAVRVARSIESLSGAFDVSYTERSPMQPSARPIHPGDAVEVAIGEDVVITGFVDSVTVGLSASAHELSISGRDAAADLVDSAPDLPPNEWYEITVFELAKILAAPFKVPVRTEVPPGRKIEKAALNPGDRAWELLEARCRFEAILPVSDGHGGIVLTRAGTLRADTALVEGENILGATLALSQAERFSHYIVKASLQGNDFQFGEQVAECIGRATDPEIKRFRPFTVVASASADSGQCADRAKWEATVRAGRGARATVVVQGWHSGGGQLWPLNALVALRSLSLGIDDEMLIVGVQQTLDEGGTKTTLELVRKEAFALIKQPEVPTLASEFGYQNQDAESDF